MTTPITTPAFSQRSTLIGRQREMAQLQQRFADAVAGQMAVALVSGTPLTSVAAAPRGASAATLLPLVMAEIRRNGGDAAMDLALLTLTPSP